MPGGRLLARHDAAAGQAHLDPDGGQDASRFPRRQAADVGHGAGRGRQRRRRVEHRGARSNVGRLTGVGPAGVVRPARRPCASGAVGGTPSRRSVASATARKTGAATAPPVRPPRRGESITTRITARGCRDGTNPTNDTLLWTFE